MYVSKLCFISFQGFLYNDISCLDLLELQPLPVTALGDTQLELLYSFSHFNPIQTQIFHCLYHTDNNVLLGAPTGSGKTIAAEIAMFRVFKQYPETKVMCLCVYLYIVLHCMESDTLIISKI